ncbi:PQQ-dependent sugar dehydrogenase [Bacillus taeanensis]|uniref:Quinoprotein glucose dehydrogenase n=1 Tax=Bacillus taeanensis TaxID=273032 RepID=A0A366XYL0_9BACI|nr:PQQ-dependent sugar dehydrogenase [Bacillus taeanensis]RBW71242.1 quinoprotein glucose dehydrogenase [Bacillus taeanensis]
MRIFLFLLMSFLLFGCAAKEEPSKVSEQEAINNEVVVLAQNLKIPWEIEKVEETFYLPERGGKIITIKGVTGKRDNVITTKEIVSEGEGGLLGLALAPDFINSRQAYIYHTYRKNGEILNRVILAEQTEDGWQEKTELLNEIPGSMIHNGGRIAIGPDQKLYITTGDGAKPERAQQLTSLGGKILRMNLDGSIPTDNPFVNSYVYSYGHRNPQGLAWDEGGQLYASEHGPSGEFGQEAHDEINLVKPGKNYGWPLVIGDQTKEGLETPLFHSGNDTWAPAGIAYKDGALYVTELRGSKLRRFDLETGEQSIVLEGFGRLRAILISDGYAYIVTSNRDGRGSPAPEDDRLMKISLP